MRDFTDRTVDSIFNADAYFDANPDVRESWERGETAGAWDHYIRYGLPEGREAFWKIEGASRNYQCDVILIDGLVDVLSQFWVLQDQMDVDLHYYIIGNDPEKFNLHVERSRITRIPLAGHPAHVVVHNLVPNLHSNYMVFGIPYLVDEDYLRSQVNRLQNSGREILIRYGFDRGNLIIIRKNTFLDMGGFRDLEYHYLEDLLQRARDEDRPFDFGELLRSASDDCPSGKAVSLRDYAMGYRKESVEADVVLPFYGQLDFVEQSVASVVEQTNADVVVHLIDDCSREDTSGFLNRWKSHPKLRVYRNNLNIGQFMSVNNVVPYLETDYVVLQDGDDISAETRIWDGVNLLGLTRSELFGSRIRIFGDEYEWNNIGMVRKVWSKRPERHWNCTFPHEIGYHYFPNPTVIMTKKSFVGMGGYTDFGDVSKNKTSNDTDLLFRYFFSGHGICYSVSNLVDVRRHANSCTQNSESGWTTPARVWATKEVERRRRSLYIDRKFIARSFGALGSMVWEGITRVWD